MNVRIGIDIGGTKALAVAYGGDGPLAQAHSYTNTDGLAGLTATVSGLVIELAAAPELAGHTIEAIGIGIPGIVDTDRGTVSHGVNVGLDSGDVPLARAITEATGIPTRLSNDVTAATIGAAHYLGSSNDVALISLGTGLAAGLILDGRPRTGLLGSAGEIGHIPYIPSGPECPCGQRGCLELYASGQALSRLWPQGGKHPATHLLAAAQNGDPAAQTALSTWIGAVAHAVTLLVLTLDVAEVLIAGGVTEVGGPLLDALRSELERQANQSRFLSQMGLAERIRLVPSEANIAPLGAALATF
ncbi:ROK family protein [Ancrocorticia populi]|uniref:Sugar kinase n=2 Tax=Ancrocorticia populi TaxID=2175228 RepID=A0A2V1K052_9ACTO|nr:ROK family protein [Ancrocorticia populi]PWF24576.1 hypothetical protein DD236_11155 [Ancrocorticia populi]